MSWVQFWSGEREKEWGIIVWRGALWCSCLLASRAFESEALTSYHSFPRSPSSPGRLATLIWVMKPLPAVWTPSALWVFTSCAVTLEEPEWDERGIFLFKDSAKQEAPGIAIGILFRRLWQDLNNFQLVKDGENLSIIKKIRYKGLKGIKHIYFHKVTIILKIHWSIWRSQGKYINSLKVDKSR